MYAIDSTVDTDLEPTHYQHLLDEGFTPEHIAKMERKGVISMPLQKSLKLRFKVFDSLNSKWVSSPGLYFPFTATFGQIRCDTPLIVPGRKKPIKYLTPLKAKTQAFEPNGMVAVTEGAKDAWRATVEGVPVGAVAGVSHICKALPKGSGHVVIFDSDGWHNPQVVSNLVRAATHLNGKINLIPRIDGEPKGGMCEWFKAGATKDDLRTLIANAMTPEQFVHRWVKHWGDYDRSTQARCVDMAITLALKLGQGTI